MPTTHAKERGGARRPTGSGARAGPPPPPALTAFRTRSAPRGRTPWTAGLHASRPHSQTRLGQHGWGARPSSAGAWPLHCCVLGRHEAQGCRWPPLFIGRVCARCALPGGLGAPFPGLTRSAASKARLPPAAFTYSPAPRHLVPGRGFGPRADPRTATGRARTGLPSPGTPEHPLSARTLAKPVSRL